MSLWIGVGAGLVLLAVMAWVASKVLRTVIAFVRELRAPLEEGVVSELPAPSLHDAESRALAAELGLRAVHRRMWWEPLGFGNPALRQRELVAACGELIGAQRTIEALHAVRPNLALHPGEPVAFVDDPVRALAARGQWAPWFALMLLPNPCRGAFVFVVVRRRISLLLDRATDFQDQLRVIRRQFAPPRPAPSALDRLADVKSSEQVA